MRRSIRRPHVTTNNLPEQPNSLPLALPLTLCLWDNLVSFVAQFFPHMKFNYAYAESPALKIYALNANRLMSEVTV